MPLDTGVWVTLDDLKEHLDIDTTDTTKDAFLTNKLNSAWKNIVRYLGQDLTEDTYTEDYDGDGTKTLVLDHFPVISITSVNSDSTRAFAASSLVDSTTYFCKLKTGVLTLFNGGVWPMGDGNIRVVHVAGFAEVPYDAKEGLLEYAALMAQRAGTEGRVTQTLGGKSEQYDLMPMPLYIREMLIDYRKIPC